MEKRRDWQKKLGGGAMVQENQRPLYKLVPGRNGQMSKAAAELKPEKPAFVLPVTTITNKQRQGLNLYGRFIQMPVI